jgi:hypothetical protein
MTNGSKKASLRGAGCLGPDLSVSGKVGGKGKAGNEQPGVLRDHLLSGVLSKEKRMFSSPSAPCFDHEQS